MEDCATLAGKYKTALLHDVIPFWESHSIDRDCGGYFTCLDAEGAVYDTDKFMWLQGRQAWMFAALYNRLERREGWLNVARHGAEFMKAHGRDGEGNWYFALDRQGRPLVQPYSIFSDCFAAMAFAQLARATGDEEARDITLVTWNNIIKRKDNPKGKYNKHYRGTRPLTGYALPMILSNLAQELSDVLDGDQVRTITDQCVRDVMDVQLDAQRGLIYENVLTGGGHADCFDGRLLIPGHGIEGMWFIMTIGEQRGDRELIDRAAQVVLDTLAFSWDEQFGGIYYFLDADGHPPQQLEWDQKLWWVHQETLIALLMGLRLTGRDELAEWFGKVHEYAWGHFADPEHGEWFGYLNRRGEVLMPAKGGKWKGCFHTPRAMWRCWQELDKLAGQSVEK